VERDRSTPGGQAVREARLKSEFSHLYPALEPNRWESAALMADRVVAWLLRQPGGGYTAPERVLRSEHFEFRGGRRETDAGGDTQRRRQKPATES
jgi:hypothetical protein